MRALDSTAFEVLSGRHTEIVRLYFGLDTAQPATKKELAQQFSLSAWQVDRILNHSVAVLLDTGTAQAADPALRRAQWIDKIRLKRLEHGRPGASTIRALDASGFAALGQVPAQLVKSFYGVGEDRPLSRHELARRHALPLSRIEVLLDEAIRWLLGPDVVPQLRRQCVICNSDSVTIRTTTRKNLWLGV